MKLYEEKEIKFDENGFEIISVEGNLLFDMEFTKDNLLSALDEFDFRSERPLTNEYKLIRRLIDEHFELKNKYEHIEAERSMFKRELSVMAAALVKACKLLKKAGVVYGKENGKPVRLGKDAWFEKLVQDATKEMELEE